MSKRHISSLSIKGDVFFAKFETKIREDVYHDTESLSLYPIEPSLLHISDGLIRPLYPYTLLFESLSLYLIELNLLRISDGLIRPK